MKKKAYAPAEPAHPDMTNPDPWSIPRSCPNCGTLAPGYEVESAEGKEPIVTCKACGFSINNAPDEEFLVDYRKLESMKKKAEEEGLFSEEDIEGLFSGELQLEQEDVSDWYAQLDETEVERFRMLQEKEQKEGLTPEEQQELSVLTQKMDALLSQARKKKLAKLLSKVGCALCKEPMTSKAAYSCIKVGLNQLDDMLCEKCFKDFEVWDMKKKLAQRHEALDCTSCGRVLDEEDIQFFLENSDVSTDDHFIDQFVMCYDCVIDTKGKFKEDSAVGQEMRSPPGNPDATPIVRTWKKEILAKDPQILSPAKWEPGEQPRMVVFKGSKFRVSPTGGYSSSWDLIPIDARGKKLGRLWMTDTGTVYRGEDPLGNIEDSVVI